MQSLFDKTFVSCILKYTHIYLYIHIYRSRGIQIHIHIQIQTHIHAWLLHRNIFVVWVYCQYFEIQHQLLAPSSSKTLLQRKRRWEEGQAGDRMLDASGWGLRQSVEALRCEGKMQTWQETHLPRRTLHTSPVTCPEHHCSSPRTPSGRQCGRGWAPSRAGGDHTAIDPEWCVQSGPRCPLCPSPPLKGADHSTLPTPSPGEKAKIKHTLLENTWPGVPRR